MGVGTLLSILLLVNMCGSNGRKLKHTGRNYFSCHACLSRWRTQSIDTAVSKQALFTDMYASECEWLQDHSNDEMLLVMIGKPCKM